MTAKEKLKTDFLNTPKAMKFLFVVLGIYLFIFIFDFSLAKKAVFETGITFLKLLPVLILVFIIIYIINRYLDASKIRRHIGTESGVMGWFYATIAGILISGPPYILYPLFKELRQKGARDAFLAVVLYNRNVKIPFIPVMIFYFGTAFTIIVSVYIILFGFLNGYLLEMFIRGSYKHK